MMGAQDGCCVGSIQEPGRIIQAGRYLGPPTIFNFAQEKAVDIPDINILPHRIAILSEVAVPNPIQIF